MKPNPQIILILVVQVILFSIYLGLKCNITSDNSLKSHPISPKNWIPRNIGIKQKHLPSFLIIGAAKCGTGALQKYLEYHPQVARSIPWEAHYFEHNADKPLDWYRNQMPMTHAEVLTFEKSAGYLYSKQAALKAANDLPGVKALALTGRSAVRFS